MDTLATSFTEQAATPPDSITFESGSVSCMLVGTGTAQCMGKIVDTGGREYARTVKISEAGDTWQTVAGDN